MQGLVYHAEQFVPHSTEESTKQKVMGLTICYIVTFVVENR